MNAGPPISRAQARESLSSETERRGCVRVDDIFPVVAGKIDRNPNLLRARVFSGVSNTPFLEEDIDDSINPLLWKMLVEIHAKLNVIFEKLVVESEGLTDAHNRQVTLSEAGASFAMSEAAVAGDLLEVKMLLPTSPPCGVVIYGTVFRVEDQGPSGWLVAVNFLEIDEEVKKAIERYIFKRQREIIAQKRDED